MSSLLAITVASRRLLSKADSSWSDCEDSIGVDPAGLRFAIADGATEGFDSRRWARYLTHAWISPTSNSLEGFDFIEHIRALGQRLERKWSGRRLPWYLEEKAASGSFAAFIGLKVTADWTWSALALGDSCLIVERNRTLEHSFPLSSGAEFSSRPTLVASKIDAATFKQALRFDRGVCLPGDVMLLMSDAIACWYLSHGTSSRELLDEFHQALDTSSAVFLEFVEKERGLRRLRNDDVAVLKLAVGPEDVDGR